MNDWPTHQGNNQRNGITSQRLSLPMNERWTYISKHAPQSAWPPPARKDPWHRPQNLTHVRFLTGLITLFQTES